MATLSLATLCAGLIGLGLIAYAVLGGADFGGGIWDLLAQGRLAERERQAIANAMGPVWEANNVWLVYVIVVAWTAFPAVYATVSTALFVPIILALIGIVCRGAAFGFRSHYARRAGIATVWGRVFSVASTITPFLLGMIAATIADGAIRIVDGTVRVHYLTVWISPFALACGAFAIGLCSVLAATYLTVEARAARDQTLMEAFALRAIIAGAVTAILGGLAAVLSAFEAPVLWHGLIGSALPLSLGAVLIGLATAASLWLGAYGAARVLVAAETACVFAAWGVAQYPYLVVPSLTLGNAATDPSVLAAVTVASAAGALVLFPSLWYLFHTFKGPSAVHPKLTAAQLADDGLARAWAEGGESGTATSATAAEQRARSTPAADPPTRVSRSPAQRAAAADHAPAGPALIGAPPLLSRARLLGAAALALALAGVWYVGRRLRRRPHGQEE